MGQYCQQMSGRSGFLMPPAIFSLWNLHGLEVIAHVMLLDLHVRCEAA